MLTGGTLARLIGLLVWGVTNAGGVGPLFEVHGEPAHGSIGWYVSHYHGLIGPCIVLSTHFLRYYATSVGP